MGEIFGCVYIQIQPNCPYPYPKSASNVPLCSLFTKQYYSTNDCVVTVIADKHNLSVSKITTTMQFDTESNSDEDIQSFFNPIKHNPITPEIHETITTTNPIQATVYSYLCQMSLSTSNTSLKFPTSGK